MAQFSFELAIFRIETNAEQEVALDAFEQVVSSGAIAASLAYCAA